MNCVLLSSPPNSDWTGKCYVIPEVSSLWCGQHFIKPLCIWRGVKNNLSRSVCFLHIFGECFSAINNKLRKKVSYVDNRTVFFSLSVSTKQSLIQAVAEGFLSTAWHFASKQVLNHGMPPCWSVTDHRVLSYNQSPKLLPQGLKVKGSLRPDVTLVWFSPLKLQTPVCEQSLSSE